jgi:hypothetical protein
MASPEEILDGTATVPENVVYREFEAETLLLNLGTGRYHGLNGTGARMLELLSETGGDVRTSVDRLAAEHGVAAAEIEGELARFCAELVERGLLEVAPR